MCVDNKCSKDGGKDEEETDEDAGNENDDGDGHND